MTLTKSYGQMLTYPTLEERFEYLSLRGRVGEETFGFERWLNQGFYTSREWRDMRWRIIARDEGRDLGVPGHEIHDKIIVHHINPLTPMDIEMGSPALLDPNNLISVSHNTHNAIHYGTAQLLIKPWEPRQPGDTKLW